MNPVSPIIGAVLPYVIAGLLILNLVQRRFQTTPPRKRLASLAWAVGLLIVFAASKLTLRFGISDLLLLPCLGVVGAGMVYLRRYTFPFTRRCRACEGRLSLLRILLVDSDLCKSCRPRLAPRSGDDTTD